MDGGRPAGAGPMHTSLHLEIVGICTALLRMAQCGKKDASEPFAVALCFFVSEPFALTYSTYISNKLDKKHGRGSIQFDGS